MARQDQAATTESDLSNVTALRVLRPSNAQRLASGFKALADPARLQIITMLQSAGEHGICVCDLVSPLRIGQSTVSHHLRVLSAAGLVRKVKRGTWAYYSIEEEALRTLLSSLPGD